MPWACGVGVWEVDSTVFCAEKTVEMSVNGDVLRVKLQELLAECDIQTTTTKKLRKLLEAHFGMRLKEWRSLIKEVSGGYTHGRHEDDRLYHRKLKNTFES